MGDTLTLPPDRRPLPWPQSTLPGYVGAPPPPPTPPPPTPPVSPPPTVSGANQPWTAATPGQPAPSYGTTPQPPPARPGPFVGTTRTQPTPGDYTPSRDGTIPPTPNNNPGNIRSGPGGSFGSYPTPQAGRDAIGNLLIAYADQHGLNTVAGMINRYCPPFDPKANKANDTAGYIRTVAAKLGVDPNQPIDVHDPATRDAMVNAIIGVEQGGRMSPPQRYVTSDQIPNLANREPSMWGRPPQGGYSVGGGVGGGIGGDLPRTIPDFINIMTRMAQMAPMLSGRSAFGQAYAANSFANFVHGYQQGQEFQTQLHAEQYKQAMTEFKDRLAMENEEIGSIVAAEEGDPEAMNRDLMEVANRNNDRVLAAAIANGPDAVKRLMQARDHLGSDASKADLALARLESQRQYQELQRLKIQQMQDPNSPLNREREARIKYLEEQTKAKEKGTINPYDPKGPGVPSDQPTTDPTAQPPATSGESDQPPPDTGDGGSGGDGGGDQGAATQAPPAPDRTAQVGQPTARQPATAPPGQTQQPYQEASLQPTPPAGGDQSQADVSAIERGRWSPPAMPTFNRLPPTSQQLARNTLEGDPEAMHNVPMNQRQPMVDAASELQGALNSIPDSFTGPDIMRAVRRIDPTLASTLGLLSQNRIGIPTGGRGTTNRTFWNRMADLAARVAPQGANGPNDPGWSADQYQQIERFKDPHGNVQQTLLRVGTMATTAKQVLEGLARMPPVGDSSYERLVQQWKTGSLQGHSEFTTMMSNLYQFVQESQYLAAGRGLEGEVQTMEKFITPEAFRQMVMPSKEQARDFIKSHSETAESRLVGFRNMWTYNHGPGPMAGEQPQAQPILNAIAGMDINNGLFDHITPETESMLPSSLTDGKGQVWWYKGTGDRTDQSNYTLTPPAQKSPATKWFQQ